jgi:hypothetical protein
MTRRRSLTIAVELLRGWCEQYDEDHDEYAERSAALAVLERWLAKGPMQRTHRR